MSSIIHYSDEELTAYLDGEMEHTTIAAINKALSHDARLRCRVESLTLDKRSIKSAFDDILDISPPAPEMLTSKAETIWDKVNPSVLSAAAVIVLCIMLGVGAGAYLPQKNNDWRYYASVYQALYVNSTLSEIERTEQELVVELKRISSVLGKEVSLSALTINKQLSYKRAQILGFNGRPLVQLAFLSSLDAPIALCIMRSESDENRAISTTTMENMSAATWEKNGYTYLLIGGNDKMLISDAAVQLSTYL
jgi:anti-sigma factor RsiW